MIFSEPTGFQEAIDSRKARALLPTNLSSQELQRIRPGVTEAATFSAKTNNARHVQKIADVIDKMQKPVGGIDPATAMQELRNSLKDLGFDPQTGSKSITNLGSDQRLRLIVDFNNTRARALGQHAQRQNATSLRLWPAQEFYRAEDRVEIRDWPAIWKANGGEFFPGASDYTEGRMIALINDPIWEAISVFGVPVAPFDWGSGMDVRPVDRAEAEDFGLIDPNEQVNPEEIDFTEPESPMELDEELQAQVLEDLGGGYVFEDTVSGKVLRRIGSGTAKNNFDPNERRDANGKWASLSGDDRKHAQDMLKEIEEAQKQKPGFKTKAARRISGALEGRNGLAIEDQSEIDRRKSGKEKRGPINYSDALKTRQEEDAKASNFMSSHPGFKNLSDSQLALVENNLKSTVPVETRTHGNLKDAVVFRGEHDVPRVVKVEPYAGGDMSSVSGSIYPHVKVTLENGAVFHDKIRISNHEQVSQNAPRHYDVDIRHPNFKASRKGWASIQDDLKKQFEPSVESMWRDQRSIIVDKIK